MKASIRKIGNSRGVILPRAALDVLVKTEQIEMMIMEGKVVLSPVYANRSVGKGDVDGYYDWDNPEEAIAWAHLQ